MHNVCAHKQHRRGYLQRPDGTICVQTVGVGEGTALPELEIQLGPRMFLDHSIELKFLDLVCRGVLDAGRSLEFAGILATKIVFNHRIANDHITEKHFLVFRRRWSPSADTNDQSNFYARVADSQTQRDTCCTSLSHPWHVAQDHIVFPDPSIDVCVRIAILLAVVSPEAVIFLVEKRFDSVSLERKGAYDRGRKVVTAFRSHLGQGP